MMTTKATTTEIANLKAAADEAQRVYMQARQALRDLRCNPRNMFPTAEQEAPLKASVTEAEARWNAAERALDEANGGEW